MNNDIRRNTPPHPVKTQNLPSALVFAAKPVAELVQLILHHGGSIGNGPLGEERVERSTSGLMSFMFWGREGTLGIVEAILKMFWLIPWEGIGEHLLEERRVPDVNLIRADANDGS